MILSHTLIIRGDKDPDGCWEIEHPDQCWVNVEDWDGGPGYRDTRCGVSGKINWDPDATGEFGILPPGRYTITYRHEGKGECYEDWFMIGCGALADHGPHEGCPGEGPERVRR
jgi:hypothetical protein